MFKCLEDACRFLDLETVPKLHEQLNIVLDIVRFLVLRKVLSVRNQS